MLVSVPFLLESVFLLVSSFLLDSSFLLVSSFLLDSLSESLEEEDEPLLSLSLLEELKRDNYIIMVILIILLVQNGSTCVQCTSHNYIYMYMYSIACIKLIIIGRVQ